MAKRAMTTRCLLCAPAVPWQVQQGCFECGSSLRPVSQARGCHGSMWRSGLSKVHTVSRICLPSLHRWRASSSSISRPFMATPSGLAHGSLHAAHTSCGSNSNSCTLTTWPPHHVTTVDAPSTSTSCTITWKDDIFGGAIVDPDSGPSEPQTYSTALREAVAGWRQQGKRGIWLKLPRARASLVQCAVEQGFDFHHAEPGYVMLTLWLPTGEPCMLPPNASHQVGVGALVINEHGHMLAVQERNGPLKGRSVWKMPTGLVHAGEDLTAAAVREVLEETGIRTTFDSVLSVRQAHGFAFGKSDLFVLCALKPEPGQTEVTPQEAEIEAACWLPLEQYTQQDTFQAELYKQAAKLHASLPFSPRKRTDLLIWGSDLEMTAEAAPSEPSSAL